MAILSIVTAVTFKSVVAISYTAEDNALSQGLKELNIREKMTWAKIKLSDHGFQNDDTVWRKIDYNIGEQYIWTTPPSKNGGTLQLGSQSVSLKRTASKNDMAGYWGRI
jgi:hypothetical protein